MIRLLAIGALLRAREVWDRLCAWLLEPAEIREHERWQQERHAAALAELNGRATEGYKAPQDALLLSSTAYDEARNLFIKNIPTTPVEPWHGKASGCA